MVEIRRFDYQCQGCKLIETLEFMNGELVRPWRFENERLIPAGRYEQLDGRIKHACGGLCDKLGETY